MSIDTRQRNEQKYERKSVVAKEVLFITHTHFDPTWRRCFDRPAKKHGVTLRSYAEVEEAVINAWLGLASKGYTFNQGQAAVWRKYLERNPDKRDELKRRADEGKLNVVLAGEVTQDTVISTAEGLVRNFLVAMPFYREWVGEEHPGLKMAWLMDAFGNSPNYPQVLKGIGAEVACHTSYKPCPEDVWVGIDGTHIHCYDNAPAERTGTWKYHPPCPECKGSGCSACDNSGIAWAGGFVVDWIRPALDKAVEAEGDWATVRCTTEEVLPDEQLVDLISEYNEKHKGKCTVRFATFYDLYRKYLPKMQAYDKGRDDSPTEDLNPGMPGCLVTRIRMKQRVRSVAYKLTAAEAQLATKAWREGKPSAPPDELAPAWRNLAFCQFHDAVTGTHIDSAYAELMEMFDEAEATADAFLPATPQTARTETFSAVDDFPLTKRLGDSEVSFDRRGILAVLKDGRDLFGAVSPENDKRRGLRIAELALEADFGDAWGKRIPEWSGIGGADASVIPLGNYHDRVEASADAIRWHGIYDGGDPKVNKLEWSVTVRPSADGKRLDFETEVDWDTESRRLRVLVPVKSDEDSATYEVPFGFIDRKFQRDKIDYGHMTVDNQEYGALHWVRKSVDDQSGVALLNKGLPCNRWMPGRGFDLSLVRSPEWAFSAVTPSHYEFWDIDGQRDTGNHFFEYSLYPYTDRLSEGDLTRAGYDYNRPAPVAPPFCVEGDVVVTAWKLAEDGSGWILRVHEAAGRSTTLTLHFDGPREVTITDLLERPQGDSVRTARFETPLHKHGILTVLVR